MATNFNLTEQEKETNMSLKRSELFAKYSFEPILIGQRVTMNNVTMSIKFTFDGFQYMFQGRESFLNWRAEVGLIPAKYIDCFPAKKSYTYIKKLDNF